ncbi:MAG: sensor histidine kinase [Eubacteriales bacterium]|nr:sensor histidine kinase [Eubacteriales bacterium]
MKKRFNKMTFSEQIKYYYVLLFLVIFILCTVFYIATARRLISTSENNTLEYGLQVVESNMESLIKNVNDYSKAIAFNDVIQEALQMDTPVGYEDKMALQESVIQMAACCDGVSSIYLFDNEGESYIAGNIYEIEAIRTHLEDTSLYQSALKKQESSSSGPVIFSYQTYLDEYQQIISFVRLIRNLDNLDAMGVLAMNISAGRIMETFDSVSAQTGMEVAILDKEGRPIVSSSQGAWLEELVTEEAMKSGEESYKVVSKEGKKYKAGVMIPENEAWSIVGAVPRSKTLSLMQQYTVFTVLLMMFGMAMCVFGASFITQRITNPLLNILNSMEHVKEGKMERVPVIETNQEMDNLQQHYNQMLEETEELMSQKVEEQRTRRKYELALLQAQIKPHFLYNTFDSVCALAMMGRTDDVYTMMQALGQYYRNSLHKGQEIITVMEELNIVENYLIIQSFRYDDVFDVVYDVDESVKPYKMIKLILQPLVENAIYHGFREHELQGTITVRAKDDGDYVRLEVEDDGVGMEPEKLNEILNKTSENPGRRFGLFGTIQRVSLYYQHENQELVNIKSQAGKGTVITVRIPKKEGEEQC